MSEYKYRLTKYATAGKESLRNADGLTEDQVEQAHNIMPFIGWLSTNSESIRNAFEAVFPATFHEISPLPERLVYSRFGTPRVGEFVALQGEVLPRQVDEDWLESCPRESFHIFNKERL